MSCACSHKSAPITELLKPTDCNNLGHNTLLSPGDKLRFNITHLDSMEKNHPRAEGDRSGIREKGYAYIEIIS